MGERLVVGGIPELRKALQAAGGRPLEKELGKVHKRIGMMVIFRVGGSISGVGLGKGAQIKPSATVREVVLFVGGAHRAGGGPVKPRQWGIRQIWPAPARPYIVGAAVELAPDIVRMYEQGIEDIWQRNSWG